MLTTIVFLPLAGALLLLLIENSDGRRDALVRWTALAASLLVFAATLLLWSRFDPTRADFQFVERRDWIPSFGVQYFVGVDGISLFLLVLTGFLTPIALLASWESVHKRAKEFAAFVLALESAMLGVFVSLDLFLFYMFWDAMLIPMYFLIGIWGYERRIYAAVKFILYTAAGSVLMLLAIIGLAWMHNSITGAGYTFDLLKLYDLRIPRQDAVLVLPRVHPRVRHQGAALPVPHVAPRRPRRGADRRFGHPRGRAPQDGHVRAAALRVPAVPGGGRVLRALSRDPGRHRDRVRRAGRHGPAGHEEAGRLLERQPPRLRRARHLRAERAGRPGGRLPDVEPRRQHRRALPDRRHAVRPSPYPADRRVRRAQGGHAAARRCLPADHAVVDRPARLERVRRRVPHPARHVPLGFPATRPSPRRA